MITRADILAHLEASMRIGFLQGNNGYTPRRGPFVREAPSARAFEVYADMATTPMPRNNGGQTSSGTDGRLVNTPLAGGIHAGGAITVLGGSEKSLVIYNQDWD